MASCGFVNQAYTLLTALWSQKRPHSRNVWLADRALMVLWHHSASPPPHVPFAIESIESIELAHRAYMSGNRWSSAFLENVGADNPVTLVTFRIVFRSNATRSVVGFPALHALQCIVSFLGESSSGRAIGHCL
jgi:hypothetical protein